MPLPTCRHLPILFLQNALAYSCRHSVALPKNFIVSGSAGFSSYALNLGSLKPQQERQSSLKDARSIFVLKCVGLCFVSFCLNLLESQLKSTKKVAEVKKFSYD